MDVRSARAIIGRPVPAALVAGVPVDDVTTEEAIELVEAFVVEGRSTGRTFQVATVNVDFVVNALADRSVQAILQRADLCLADGMPIVWHARVSRTPLRARVAGADIVPLLVERARTSGWRVLLFGSAPGIAESAASLLMERYPGVEVDALSGPMITDVHHLDDSWIEQIRALQPDVVCVALGNPKQERFIAAHRSRLGAPVMIGVGGTLDFIVGGRRRAPTILQRAGLEWVYRAAQEPRRLGRRYAHDVRAFGPLLARAVVERLRARFQGTAGAARIEPHPSSLDGNDVVDLTAWNDLNPSDMARLVGLARDAHRQGRALTLIGCSPATRSTLDATHEPEFFKFLDQVHQQSADE